MYSNTYKCTVQEEWSDECTFFSIEWKNWIESMNMHWEKRTISVRDIFIPIILCCSRRIHLYMRSGLSLSSLCSSFTIHTHITPSTCMHTSDKCFVMHAHIVISFPMSEQGRVKIWFALSFVIESIRVCVFNLLVCWRQLTNWPIVGLPFTSRSFISFFHPTHLHPILSS